jgi:predicted phosphodiesterase
MRIQFVGDIHGNIQAIDALRLNHTQYDLTIQVGDFGIGFGAEGYLGYFDPNLFKILFGNHDNYFTLSQYPHNLGRFGIYNFNGYKIFFIGGAWSRDWQCRTEWRSNSGKFVYFFPQSDRLAIVFEANFVFPIFFPIWNIL